MTAAITMTEAQFTRTVIDCARVFGWRVAHFRPAFDRGRFRTAVQGDGAGFPDLVMTNGKRLVFAELKVGRNNTTGAQFRWLDDLRSAGCEAFVWKPENWPEIERLLRGE